MPATTIEVRRKYTTEQEIALIDAVQAALVEGLRIPEWTKTIRFIAHEPHRFAVDRSRDERFTLVSIDLFPGRSIEAKRRLYAALVRNLARFDIPADHVKIVLREVARENWGLRGVPSSEIELPYEVEV
jgi:phenylpyruvate tautomerase PptA (4-oxalocrotonate tautomerase family)